MSCILTMTSAAIIAGISLTGISSLTLFRATKNKEIQSEAFEEGLETIFNDSQILYETLKNEYDCHVNVISQNEYDVVTSCGNLKYKRNSENEAFRLYMNNITDVDKLISNIRSFEQDYGKNVQAYTYAHIKENLSAGMQISNEEFLEDDSILLTIRVE